MVHSPFMFWLYHVLSAQAVSNLIGIIEVSVAILIALGPFSALLSLVGGVLIPGGWTVGGKSD